jgi:hypothetical protein
MRGWDPWRCIVSVYYPNERVYKPRKATYGRLESRKRRWWSSVLRVYIVPAECVTRATFSAPTCFRRCGTVSSHTLIRRLSVTGVEPPKPGLHCSAVDSEETCYSVPIDTDHPNTTVSRQFVDVKRCPSRAEHRPDEEYGRKIDIVKIRRCCISRPQLRMIRCLRQP